MGFCCRDREEALDPGVPPASLCSQHGTTLPGSLGFLLFELFFQVEGGRMQAQ